MTAFLVMETIRFPPWEQSEGIHPAGPARDSLDNLKYGVYQVQCSKQTDRCMRHMHEYDGQGRGGGLWPVSTALEDVWLGNGAFHEATKKQSCRGFLPFGDEDATGPWAEEEQRKKHKKNGSMVLLRNRRLSKAGHCRQNSPEALRLWPTATAVLDLSYPCVLTASWVRRASAQMSTCTPENCKVRDRRLE